MQLQNTSLDFPHPPVQQFVSLSLGGSMVSLFVCGALKFHMECLLWQALTVYAKVS